ncbi:MAG: 30S ribosomal protein S18 [Acidimicrobiia bacterium]
MVSRGRSRRRRRDERAGRQVKKRVCYFCKEKIDYIDYKDVALLRKYMSDRAKIRSSRVTGNCVQHQRKVANAIKNARELALLPYTNR